MQPVKDIYIFIHSGFYYLSRLANTDWRPALKPNAEQTYRTVLERQQALLSSLRTNSESGLIIIPYVYNVLRYVEHLQLSEEQLNILHNEIDTVVGLKDTLQERCVVLDNEKFAIEPIKLGNVTVSEMKHPLMNYPHLEDAITFAFNPATVRCHAFGEYTYYCVSGYGHTIRRLLQIPEDHFIREDGLSMDRWQYDEEISFGRKECL